MSEGSPVLVRSVRREALADGSSKTGQPSREDPVKMAQTKKEILTGKGDQRTAPRPRKRAPVALSPAPITLTSWEAAVVVDALRFVAENARLVHEKRLERVPADVEVQRARARDLATDLELKLREGRRHG